MADLIPGVGTPLGGLAQAQQFFGRRKLRKASTKRKKAPSEHLPQETDCDDEPIVYIGKADRICATPKCGTVLSVTNPEKECRHCLALRRAAKFHEQVMQAAKGIPANLLPLQQKKFALSMGVTAAGRRP